MRVYWRHHAAHFVKQASPLQFTCMGGLFAYSKLGVGANLFK